MNYLQLSGQDMVAAGHLPVAAIDHVVVNAGRALPAAADRYARLGFTLTPEGRHTLGTLNNLTMFGPDYLELLGVGERPASGLDVLNWPPGLGAIAFATDEAQGIHAALSAAGVAVQAPLDFSRPVELPGGARDAAFRVVRLAPEATQACRLFFCQHFTRDVVWCNEWRRHANGVLGIDAIVIAARDPAALGALFTAMFGVAAVAPVPGGLRLAAGLSRIEVLEPAAVAARYGDAAPAPEDRAAWAAVLSLRTAGRAAPEAALRQGGIAGVRERDGALLVPAAEALGVAMEFRPA
jgi:hypothetical protein